MEIRNYLQILGRRKWIVITTVIVTLLVVSVTTFSMTPIYSTSTLVRIAQVQDRSVDYFNLNYSMRLINTYVELVRSRPFLIETIQRLGLSSDPENMSKAVKAESLTDTELLKITAESSDPLTANQIANTLGQLLVEEGEKLYSGQGMSAREILLDQLLALENEISTDRERLQILIGDELDEELSPEAQDLATLISLQEQTYRTVLDAYENARLSDAARANSITVVDPAAIPAGPSRPNVRLNLALGALLGLTAGIGLAFVIENFDTSIYTADEFDRITQAPLLATIPRLKVPTKMRGMPILVQPNGKSSAAEVFRILRSNILTMDHGRPPRSILVTSVEKGAGKSTVLSNLAVALGQVGRTVVVIDSDLRSPSLSRVFGVSNDKGLKSVILHSEKPASAIQKTKVPGVSVLPSGSQPHSPAELLGLPSLRTFIGDLANWSDLVLLDSPPLAQFSDAVVLAPLVDTVLIVVGRGRVSEEQVQKAVAQLALVGAGQIGLVFNKHN